MKANTNGAAISLVTFRQYRCEKVSDAHRSYLLPKPRPPPIPGRRFLAGIPKQTTSQTTTIQTAEKAKTQHPTDSHAGKMQLGCVSVKKITFNSVPSTEVLDKNKSSTDNRESATFLLRPRLRPAS